MRKQNQNSASCQCSPLLPTSKTFPTRRATLEVDQSIHQHISFESMRLLQSQLCLRKHYPQTGSQDTSAPRAVDQGLKVGDDEGWLLRQRQREDSGSITNAPWKKIDGTMKVLREVKALESYLSFTVRRR